MKDSQVEVKGTALLVASSLFEVCANLTSVALLLLNTLHVDFRNGSRRSESSSERPPSEGLGESAQKTKYLDSNSDVVDFTYNRVSVHTSHHLRGHSE